MSPTFSSSWACCLEPRFPFIREQKCFYITDCPGISLYLTVMQWILFILYLVCFWPFSFEIITSYITFTFWLCLMQKKKVESYKSAILRWGLGRWGQIIWSPKETFHSWCSHLLKREHVLENGALRPLFSFEKVGQHDFQNDFTFQSFHQDMTWPI